ncbi:MAG: NHLP leader peptide family RiPP precursor [Pseudomonadota bacterium]|nr:NHLP leader peptide family RiPP precursor [Pseudomonadota bacterium]
MKQEAQIQKLNQIIAKCWSDTAFKTKLLANPVEVFKAEGLSMPQGVELCVLENSAALSYLVIPARPAELTDEALDAAAGGASLRDQLLASTKHKPRL